MRRISNSRTLKSLKQKSPTNSEAISAFKKADCKRGHSLMRRTELSWEKLQNKETNTPKVPRGEENLENNDYFAGRRQKQAKTPQLRQKIKGVGNQNSKVKFNQRTKLFFRDKHAPKIQPELKPNNTNKKQPLSPLMKRKGHISSKNTLQNFRVKMENKKFQRTQRQARLPTTAQTYEIDKFRKKQIRNAEHRKTEKNKIQQAEIEEEKFQETYQLDLVRVKEQKKRQSAEPEESHLQADLKSKQQFSTMSSLRNSVLPLFSRKCSAVSNPDGTANKITLHLEILGQLAQYSKQLLQMYEDTSQWQELVFLVYKKYYIERLKVARVLRGIGYNPFQLSVCSVTNEELQTFRKRLEGIKLAKEVEAQNRTVADSLRCFYNLIIEKSGNHINMEERNDFASEIFRDMQTEIDLLKEIGGTDAQKRLGRVFRCAFLIAQLEGNLVISYEQSLDTDDFGSYLKKAANLFHQCLIL